MTKKQAYINVLERLPFDPKIVQRLDRASEQVLGYGYEVKHAGIATSGERLYYISKASTSLLDDNGHTYGVTNKTCNCPDFETARAGLCKHRLAVMLLEEMELD